MKKILKKIKRIYKKKPSMVIIPCVIVILLIISVTSLLIFLGNKNKKSDFSPEKYENITFNISEGEFKNLTVKKVNGQLMAEVKVRIRPLDTNQETIDMIYRISEEIVTDKKCDDFDEIFFWATGIMQSGSEAKVMSFEFTRDNIEKIRNNNIPSTEYVNYVENVYIFPAMRD